MINAVIYDMDGLIIDTEPFWKIVEIEVFGQLGLILTEKDCAETAGLRIDEVVDYWQVRNPQLALKKAETVERILKRMEEFILLKGEALPGLYDSLEYFKAARVKLAIASSSPFVLINACVKALNLLPYFSNVLNLDNNGSALNEKIFFSAESEKKGKPAPDIFLACAKGLEVTPENCIVLEDSIAGVKAGKTAGMTVVAVPNANDFDDPRFDIADHKINSLEGITKLLLF